MKFLNIIMTLLLVVWTAACGTGTDSATIKAATSSSSSSSSSSSTTTGTGTFYGSTIQGVQYYNSLTGSLLASNPYTNSSGQFSYTYDADTASQVTFHVGNIILGTATIAPAKTTSITAYDLVKNNTDSTSQAVNIMRFLKSTSVNSSTDTNIITISDNVRSSLSQVTALDISSTTTSNNTFETAIDARLQNLPGYVAATDLPSAATLSSNLNITSTLVEAAKMGSLTVTAGASSLPADGSSMVGITATVTNTLNAALIGAPVRFSTTSGTLSASVAQTNSNGKAIVTLKAPTSTANATITASYGGSNQLVNVTFIAGSVTTAQSSLTANPTTLVSDGVATTTITLILKDSNNNPVADGTSATLITTAGTITSTNPATTSSGRISFTVLAPKTPGVGTISLQEYPTLTTSVTFGTLSSSGEPASIKFTPASSKIFVAEVGETENTTITINVSDDAGNPINESIYPASFNTLDSNSNNNLKITLVTFPNANEFISAINAAGSTVSTTSSTPIWVRTSNGSAILNLKSGTLPGVVEIKAEVIKKNGTTIGATALAPKITISSGKPHSIVLSAPKLNAIQDLGGGVYCRTGTALVTDRWGNTVPDGTSVSLGIMDTVIAEGTDGAVTLNSKNLLSATNFTTASIIRNNSTRKIELSDRIILQDATSNDKQRFVSDINGTTISAQSNYQNTASNQHFFVGAATLGASIGGGESCTKLTAGTMTTIDGKSTIWVRYPAHNDNTGTSKGTILLGCYGYSIADTYAGDSRYSSANSAQVIVVASSQDSSATTISKGKFCFSAMSPLTIKSTDSSFSFSASGAKSFNISVRDKGEILLPYYTVYCSAAITKGDAQISIPTQSVNTDIDGTAQFSFTVIQGTTESTGSITCKSGDSADLTMSVKVL